MFLQATPQKVEALLQRVLAQYSFEVLLYKIEVNGTLVEIGPEIYGL